ncbi:MAG: hypothetical protein HPY54_14535 [Chthonomonadetes bacterium]|nr:hypothetical protein [Chthonomonadetes bacterium]
MEWLIDHISGRFNSTTYAQFETVLSWAILFLVVLLVIHEIASKLVDVRIRRLVAMAEQNIQKGDYQAAARCYSRAIRMTDVTNDFRLRVSVKEAHLLKRLAQVEAVLGNYLCAAQLYQEYLLRQWRSTRHLLQYVSFLEADLDMATSNRPMHWAEDYAFLGEMLLRAGCAEEAILWLKRTVVADPERVSSWRMLAQGYEQVGMTLQAQEALEQVRRLAQQQDDI